MTNPTCPSCGRMSTGELDCHHCGHGGFRHRPRFEARPLSQRARRALERHRNAEPNPATEERDREAG